jgi:hypothetical protein
MKVIPITVKEARPWLEQKHYAHIVPSILYTFGMVIDGKLSGVCTFGSPTRVFNNGGALFDNKLEVKVLELNRLIVDEGLPKNTLSQFVSQCLKQLPRPCAVVSYSDQNFGHHGYIYQALNFLYTGHSPRERYYVDETGKKVHSRTLSHLVGTISREKYTELGYRMVEEKGKYRYILFLGSKVERKRMRNLLKYEVLPYPKGENIRYEIEPFEVIPTLI